MRWTVSILLALAAAAQQNEVVFRANSNLVVFDVSVRDRSGKSIEDLKKNDFTILEDGKPQTISVFEFQRIEPPASEAAPVTTATAPGVSEPRKTRITAASPGKVQYRDKRLLVLFFDFSSMQPPEQIRAQKAALDFLDKQMKPADMVSILTFSTRLKVEQDFTGDKDKLTEIVRGFHIGEGSDLAVDADTADPDVGQDTGAAFVADETEFNIFNTDRKLSALESAAKMLAPLPEKKALVYFSSGIGKTGIENHSQLRSTVNAAVRANVSFYPVDARGLTALVPGGDASQASSRGTGMFTGKAQTGQREKFNDQQETLTTLAADTGGKSFLDNNDLSLGIAQAQQDVRSYYILGYYSTDERTDGRFRRVQVKVASHPQAKLDYRSGYFGVKQFGKFDANDKERQLEEALSLGDPVTDLPLALEVDYFRLAKSTYFVPVAVKIPGSLIALQRKGSNEVTEFDFIGQVTDARGRLAGSVRDGIKVKLSEADAARASNRNFQYDTGFTLSPGQYKLKFLARENQTGKMGTFETSFTIPDINSEKTRLRTSSVIWSNQREPLAAAIGSAESKKKLLAMNPLVRDGQKLVPNITHVFRRNQNLYVYLEVYDPATEENSKATSVAANLSFFAGDHKAFESAPVRINEKAPSRENTVPVQFQLPMERLTPGRYICQVNVIDEQGRKFAFARAPVVVLGEKN